MTKKVQQHNNLTKKEKPKHSEKMQEDKTPSDKKAGERWCDQPDQRDYVLTRDEARGGSPADISVGGEEDAGVGLEFLVRKIDR